MTAAPALRQLSMAEVGQTVFEVVESGAAYRMSVPGLLVAFEADRLSWHSHELHGELLVRCDMLGTNAVHGDVLSLATFNFSAARGRSERATLLAKQANAPDIPWQPLLELFCQSVLREERSGEPATPLRTIERPDEQDQLLHVFGFKLPRRLPGIVFGDGGSAKSYLALYVAGLLAREGYRVGLFDWELDGSVHRSRYEAIFGDDMPAALLYAKCGRPLIHEVDRLKRIVRHEGLDYAVFDSIGFACHVPPEEATAALTYFQAVNRIGIGSLHIAHISKSEGGDQKPFGSAFFHNSARATWFLKASDELGSIGVFNRKHNLAPKQPPFGISVEFDKDRTRFSLNDIATVPEFAAQVPITERLRSFLRGGARTREEIVAELSDAKPETVRRTLDRELRKERLVEILAVGGEARIGLRQRAS